MQGVGAVDVAELLLLHHLQDDLLLAREVRVVEVREVVDEVVADRLVVARRDLGRSFARRGRIAPGEVDVQLGRSTRVAHLDERRRSGAAVRALLRPVAQALERLRDVHGVPLRREAVVRRDERRRLVAHQLTCQRERLVGLLVRGPDVALALVDPAVGDVVVRQVVEVRVRVAVDVGRRDEAHELVRELVGHRVADREQIGLDAEAVDRPDRVHGGDGTVGEDVAQVATSGRPSIAGPARRRCPRRRSAPRAARSRRRSTSGSARPASPRTPPTRRRRARYRSR